MRLIISRDNQLVGLVEDYQGPVPRKGEFIHSPRGLQPVPGVLDGFMIVQSVIWGIIGRPDGGEGYFTSAAEPFVEVIV